MKSFILSLLLFVCSAQQTHATVFGNTPATPSPRIYTLVFFPANYQSDPASVDLIQKLGSDPTLIDLRHLTSVVTFSVSDPDFTCRYAKKMPQVVNNHQNAVIVIKDGQPLYGNVGLTGDRLSQELTQYAVLEQVGLRGGRFRPLRPNCPNCPNNPNGPCPNPGPDRPNKPNTPDPVIDLSNPDKPNTPDNPDKPLLPFLPNQPVTPVPNPTTPDTTTSIPTPQQPANPYIDKINEEVHDQLEELTQQVETATEQQQALQQQITQVLNMPAQAAPQIDLTPVVNAINADKPQPVDFAPVINAIQANKPDFTQVMQLLQEIKQQGSTPIVLPAPKVAQPYVLVTSNFLCDDCPGVVAKAKEVRDKKGINIRIVKLDGALSGLSPDQKASIKLDGVPVLYDFGASRTIVGSTAVLEFLNSL